MRKQSPYGPFVKRVLLPALRIGLLLLALLAIGFGSWLETNDSIESCAFKNSMSFHQVYLYRNISSNQTTPDSVSFGLWKSCYFYALNCSCTLTNLKYQPDVGHILQVATENNAKPPLTTTSTTSKFIPLIISTVFVGIAFFMGLWANRRDQFLCRKIICGLVLSSVVMTGYVFASTYTTYFNSIKHTCKDPTNTIYCARHAVGIEVIILTTAVALLFITFIFWFFVASFFKTTTRELEDDVDPDDHYHWWHFFFPKPALEVEDSKEPIDYFTLDQSNTMLQQYHRQQLQQKKQYTNNNNYSTQSKKFFKPNLTFPTSTVTPIKKKLPQQDHYKKKSPDDQDFKKKYPTPHKK